MGITQKHLDQLTYTIIGCAIEVHKQLGPGLIESVYEKCFVHELASKGLSYIRQQIVPIVYKELKSNEGFAPVHEAILLSYMKLLEKPKGILINFNCTNIFKEGQKTLVNEYYAALPKT